MSTAKDDNNKKLKRRNLIMMMKTLPLGIRFGNLEGAQFAMIRAGLVGEKYEIQVKVISNSGKVGRPKTGDTSVVYIPSRKYAPRKENSEI